MLRRGWLRGELVVVVLATAALGACGTGSAINAGAAAGPSGSGPCHYGSAALPALHRPPRALPGAARRHVIQVPMFLTAR